METLVFEDIILGLGSLGLVIALVWVALRSKKAPSEETKETAALSEKSETVADVDLKTPASKEETAGTSWWNALAKTRNRFTWGSGNTDIASLKDSLEEACIVSDLGVQNTQEVLETLDWDKLTQLPEEDRIHEAKRLLGETLSQWVTLENAPSAWPAKAAEDGPTVIWFVGVNGVGKTTSIAKLAHELVGRGHSVMLAAGDTFRAAAGEQLETWAQRLGIPCVRGAAGADSSSVLFDTIQSAKAKKTDYVLCDSAGRLHNHSQLMDALKKNQRVMDKALEGAPHHKVLVLDANTGQNMLSQAKQFQADIGLTGLILTKLDGSAKGGAVVAVSRQTRLPIQRLGLGEKERDFVAFDAPAFIDALLGLQEKVKVNSQEPVQSL